MRLAVLTSPQSWYFRDLARAAHGEHELFPVPFSRLSASLSVAEAAGVRNEMLAGEFDLAGCDALLVRTMPPGSLEQVIFRMDVLARLEAAGLPVVNPPKALEAAIDKYLALARLEAAGLTVPPTIVCQSVEDAMRGYFRLGGDVVVKPLFGGEGRGIFRVHDEAAAERAMSMLAQLGGVIYLQKFIDHGGADLRLAVLGSRVLGMRRVNPLDWRTNISRGAAAEPLPVSADLAELAQRAAAAIGAPLAGVDLIIGRDGRQYVLEVNAVPGWRGLARATGEDVARLILDFTAQLVREGRS